MEDLASTEELGLETFPSAHEENGSLENGTENYTDIGHEDVPNGKLAFEAENPDEKMEALSTKLKLALKEIINKDNLVKQHAKVAEEAISGWEKAEAEAAVFKQQLDSSVQQKLVLEERVGHLDGALKECVKQMRNVREEQEAKQEEHAKKTKEWDTIRSELEAKLAETTVQVGNHESMQQRISSLTESHAQAQTEAKRYSVKMEAVDKENVTLRHDVRTLKKELVALNGESKKAVDIVKQQNAEYVKKVTKLEAECQKLKGLLRKKAAASQAGGETLDRRKSLGGRITSSPRAPSIESMEDMSEMSHREMADDKLALEDETRTLKQVIDRKNKELQAARFLCARTASKLEETMDTATFASLNGHLETLRAFGNNQPSSIASQGSCNGEEADELSHFRKGREGRKPDKLLDTTSFELMDDFLEMEKLTSNLPHENGRLWEAATREGSPDSNCSESVLAIREKELFAANEMCKALHQKVTDLESQLHAVPSANGLQNEGTGHKEADNLSRIISDILLAMEDLAKGTGPEYTSLQPNGTSDDEVLRCGLMWINTDLDSAFKKVASAGNSFLQGRGDNLQGFMVELGAVLKVLGDLCSKIRNSDLNRIRGLQEANAVLETNMAGLQEELADVKASSLKTSSRMQQTLDALTAEKMSFENRLEAATKALNEKDLYVSTINVEKRDIESRLSTAQTVAEQLRMQLDKIALLEAEVGNVKLEKEATVSRLTEELDKMITENHDAEATVKRLTEDLTRIKGAMDVGEADLVAAKQELEQVRHQLTVVELEKEKLSEALEVQLQNTEDVVRATDEEVQRVKADMAVVESEKEKLAHELETQLDRISTLEEELTYEKAAAHDSLSAVNVDVEKMVIESAELKYEKHKLEKALSLAKEQLQEEVATLTTHIEKLEEDLKKLAVEKDDNIQKVEEMRIELERLADEIVKTKAEKEAAEKSLDTIKAENSQLQNGKDEQLQACEEKLKSQQANFISLQEEFYQMKIEKEDMEQSLTIADQNLQLSHNRIASLMEEHAKFKLVTSSSYEQARVDFERSDRELKLVADEKEKLGSDISALSKVVENLEAELKNVKADGDSKLAAAGEQIKHLEGECDRLENEKMDLEEVLASTNEMAQTVKAEFNSLSNSTEELGILKAEKKNLEDLLVAAEESIDAVTSELKKLEAEKAELEHDLALAQVTWKSQLFEANELVASVRAELALALKSKQFAEDELAQSFSAKAELQYQVKAAEHEANQLQEKARNLEIEREASKIEIENLQHQLSTRTEYTVEDETTASSLASGSHEGFAAKLDECHRAILSLGQQLHSITNSRSSPSMTEQAISEESIGTLQESGEAICDESAQSKETSEVTVEAVDGKVFVPSIPLEGRPRSKSTSTSPAKPKHSSSRTSANSDLSKSFDMGSPSEKPSSSSSGFSRFFRGKSSSSHHHA